MVNMGRSGEKFRHLSNTIANEYEKKGFSVAKAKAIGQATAGKQFWHKYGKKSGSWILKRER